jgi:uncharacterized protein
VKIYLGQVRHRRTSALDWLQSSHATFSFFLVLRVLNYFAIILLMLIKVKAFPGASQEKIIKKSEDSFEIYVRAKPIGGAANQAIIQAISKYFGLSEKEIKMVKGFKERNKIFLVNIIK